MEAGLKKPTVEIPPRKLLFCSKTRKRGCDVTTSAKLQDADSPDYYCYDSDSDDPYATDHFRIYEFKIRRCTRSRSHDWTDCPFAHPGEKARRRDPRLYHYSGDVCPEFRRGGSCSRGDDCDFAHGVFECWLHPSRYRTEACKDGKHCKRKVCFFAHSPRQLRVLPPENVSAGSSSSSSLSPASVLCNKNRCCLFCHSLSGSPTSTLPGISHISRSPSVSPPLSPAMTRLRNRGGTVTYKDVLNELMSSLENMSLREALASSPYPATTLGMGTSGANNQQLAWAENPLGKEWSTIGAVEKEQGAVECGDPDIGWVNDLLM